MIRLRGDAPINSTPPYCLRRYDEGMAKTLPVPAEHSGVWTREEVERRIRPPVYKTKEEQLAAVRRATRGVRIETTLSPGIFRQG